MKLIELPLRSNLLGLVIMLIAACGAQAQPPRMPKVSDEEFDEVIRDYISFSVPVIGCTELDTIRSEVLLLDARESEEYEVSHLPGARHVGFKNFDAESVADLPKDQPIVVYCSIGYRSEKIGEKLQGLGFTNVKNLYGSIFEWVNLDKPIVNNEGQTMQVHTYSKKWGKWVKNPSAAKVTK